MDSSEETTTGPDLPRDSSGATNDAGTRRVLRRGLRRRLIIYLLVLVIMKLIGCNQLFYHPDSGVYREPDELSAPCEEIDFESGDGTRLHGWFLRASGDGEALGTVVHFHGNAQNLSSHVAFVEWLPERGFNVLTFDYRGYGKSEGSPSRDGIHQDGMAVLEYARSRPDIDASRLVVLGQSLGGAVALAALGEGDPAGVRAIAVESTFLWYRDVANGALGGTFLTYPLVWLLISNDHSPGQSIDRLSTIPLLVLHGGADRTVGPQNGRAVHRAARGVKHLEIVPQARHLRLLHGPQSGEARQRLVDFFKESLGAR